MTSSHRYSSDNESRQDLAPRRKPPSKRIKAPAIDTSALIMENTLTMIGRTRDTTRDSYGRTKHRSTSPGQRASQRQTGHREGKAPMVEEPFHRRLDRHGRPFGERLPNPTTRSLPLRNKITPHDANTEQAHQYVRRREQRHGAPDPYQNSAGDRRHRAPTLQWRERNIRISPPQAAEGPTQDRRTPSPASPHQSPREHTIPLASLTPIPEDQTLQSDVRRRRSDETNPGSSTASTPGRQRKTRRSSQSPLLRSGVKNPDKDK
ncbi:hypothetical protein YC2023_064996 [Brassica napus]